MDSVINQPTLTTYPDGSQAWYLHDQLHREDGPAIIYPNGKQAWHLHGQRHREDGPAIIYPNGYQVWYLHGKRHREDGPAVIHPNGLQYWYLHGQRHREDGPAIINPDGRQEWYLHGVEVSAEEVFSSKNNEIKENSKENTLANCSLNIILANPNFHLISIIGECHFHLNRDQVIAELEEVGDQNIKLEIIPDNEEIRIMPHVME